MLHVQVTIRASSISGLGVFAAAPIAKGAVVWSFTPGFDLETELAELESLPALLQQRLYHYGYVDKRLGKYVLCCDDARFLNHSSTPNLVHDGNDGGHGIDRAARDIAIGEELTVDYGMFEACMLAEPGPPLGVARTGIILNTQNFAACRRFYREVLGLKELFAKAEAGHELSCLDFGGSYLMVETGGHANPDGKSVRESAAKLRFNVSDLEATLSYLLERGIEAKIEQHDWGATINLYDPDGNRIGIRDEAGFIAQLSVQNAGSR